MTQEKKEDTGVKNEMVDVALTFWFNDQGHIRSPFPLYIREPLRNQAVDKFFEWVGKISDRARGEINDEIVAEKFEEILFETAAELVRTQDERLTILYPFMPRLGDVITPKETDAMNGQSLVIERIHLRRGDQSYLKIKLKSTLTENEWETEFELPA